MRKSSRPGRYRKILMGLEELAPIAKNLEGLFSDLNELRKQGQLSDAEFLGYGLLALLACRQNQAFQNNTSLPTSPNSVPSILPAFGIDDFRKLLQKYSLPLYAFQFRANANHWSPNPSLVDFLTRIRFRGIPISAQQALLAWLEGRYPLTLTFQIPTGAEVFALQKQGGRCVTFFLLAEEMVIWHNERDTLSFIIHDLIHAHEFYADAQRAKQQIGFYHWLESIRSHGQLQILLAESAAFSAMWEYLLSDMNSYCGHLLKTLHAAFNLYAKPDEVFEIWRQVVRDSSLLPEEQELFLKVNTPDWGEREFLQLEAVLEKMSPA